MKVTKVLLVKSPFDINYLNVPDNLSANPSTFYNDFIRYIMDGHIDFREIKLPQDMSVPLNYRTSATILLDITDFSIYEYNYMILMDEDLDLSEYIDENTARYNMGWYFINEVQINNTITKKSATFTLVRDVWTSNYSYLENTRGMIDKKHQKMLDGNHADPNYILSPTVEHPRYSTLWCGDMDDYDILWLRIKIDPLKDSKLRVIDIEDQTVTTQSLRYPKEYGILNYFFIPYKSFYKGMPFANNSPIYKYYIYNGNTYYTFANMYNILTDVFDMQSSYILDMDFTFYPPFKWRVVDDVLRITTSEAYIGYLEIDGNIELNKAGVGLIRDAEYSSLITTIEYDDLKCYVDSGDGLVNVGTWSDVVNRYFNIENSYNGTLTPREMQNINPDFSTYPFLKTTIQYPTREIDITPYYFNYKFRVVIYPKDSGVRYAIDCFEENELSEKIRMFETMASNEGFDGTGSLPLSLSNYETYRVNNGSRYDVDYSAKKENLVLDTSFSILSGAAGMTTGKVKDIASGVVSIAQTTATSFAKGRQLALGRNALEADLKRQCSHVSNVSSNAMTDTFFQDRVVIVVKDAYYIESLDDTIIDRHIHGSILNVYGNPLQNSRQYYDYVSCSNANFSNVKNYADREVISRIFAQGTRKWHIDKYPSPTLNYYISNGDRSE